MASDPTRPGHLAIAYQDGFSLATCFLARSSDGGRTWAQERLVGRRARIPLPANAFCWNPLLAFGPDGSLYYVFQTGFYFNQGEPKVLLVSSRDGGATFGSPVGIAVGPESNQFWPAVDVDQRTGRVYVSFTRSVFGPNGAGPIGVVSSADGGRTFSQPLPPNPAHLISLGSVLAVGPDGRIYIGYLDQRQNAFGADPDAIVGVSSDEGRTFRTTSFGPTAGGCVGRGGSFNRLHGDGPCRLVVVAAGQAPGEGYVAWWDQRGVEGLSRVVLSRTIDGGASWSAARVIALSQGLEADHQHRPWLTVAPDGTLHVAFYNREGKDQDGPQDLYLISSTDRGLTFDKPRRLNDVSSDSRLGSTGRVPGGHPSLGDLVAAVAGIDGVAAAWTDMRRSDAEAGNQDIYFTSTEPGFGAALRPAVADAPSPSRTPGGQLPATGTDAAPSTLLSAVALLLLLRVVASRYAVRRSVPCRGGTR